MRLPSLRVLLLVAAAVASSSAAQADTEKQLPHGKPTFAQQREINKIVGKYRLARTDLKKKTAAVRGAIDYGAAAVSAMKRVIENDLNPQLVHYRGSLINRAAAVYQERTGGSNLEEIVKLQQMVLGLQHREGFSKELIVGQADPAMKRLEEIFLIDPAEVLEGAKSLMEERRRIGQIGKLWEMCEVYLYKAIPDGEEKPKEVPSFEGYLQGEEKLAVGLAAPMDARTRAVLSANMQLARRIDREEARAVLALNLTRNLLGLPAVIIDLKLCAAARDHSKDMETLKFFAHESKVPGKATPWDRAKRFGTSASSENIFMGTTDGRAANLAWFHSPGHHKNMLGKHSRVGMGRSGRYFTEMFGR